MIDATRSMLFHIGNLNTESQRISYQMGTGKNLKEGSEDSLLHANIIQIEDKLRVTQNLQLQIIKSKGANDVSDSSFAEMKKLLDAVKVDLMRGLNDGIDRNDKLALATNLEGMRENMFDLSNVRVDGEYIFSGSVTTEQTFVKDPDYNSNGKISYGGDGFLRKIAVQPGSYRDRGVTGYDVGFYTAGSAISSERLFIEDGERIVDSEGYEWKMNNDNGHHTKLQRYDHNGAIFHPPVEIDLYMKSDDQIRVDLGTGSGFVAAGGESYEITIDGGLGANTYTYVAGAGDDENAIFAGLSALIAVDGYTIDGSLHEDDKFYVYHTSDMTWSTPTTNTLGVSNEIEASSTNLAEKAVYYVDIPASITPTGGEVVDLSHIKFESKHNYFDDVNQILNAYKGYNTRLDGRIGDVISDGLVDDALRTGLDQTSQQFDSTNIGHGELGGRNNVFNIAYDKLSAQETHYNILLTETSGADMAKLAMESQALEMTYSGLYSTIMKMNELSLVNFMR